MAITVEARTEIISLVVGMFGAAPGASVLSDLVAAYEAGSTVSQIAASLANTNEFKSIYPTFLTNAEYATKVVDNLLPEASATAKAEAVTVLTAELNGGMTRTTAMVEAIKFVSATATDNAAYGTSAAAFDNKVAIAIYYSVDKQLSASTLDALQEVVRTVTSSAASVTAATASINGESTQGGTFSFTTGVDTLTGTKNNDTFNALPGASNALTFTTLDSVDGGDGTDTLNVTDVNATGAQAFVLNAATTVKSIEVANVLVGSDNVGDTVTADVSAWTGLQTLNVTVSGTDAPVTVTTKGNATTVMVDGATTAGITDSATTDKLTTATITNASGLATITSSALTTLNLNASTGGATVTAAAATRALTVNLNGVTAGTVTDAEATSLTLNAATVKSSGATVVAAKAKTVAINADESLSLTALTTAAATGLTVTGDSTVTLAAATLTALTSIDTSAQTAGGLDTKAFALGTGVAYTGGAGADSLQIGATTKALTTGAGNDRVLLSATVTALGTGGSVDAGEGTADVLAFADGDDAGTASGGTTFEAKVSGFEVVELAGAAGAGVALNLANLDDISSVKLSADLGQALTITNMASGGTLSATVSQTGATSVGVVNALAGTTDVVNVSLAGTAAVNSGTLTIADVETVAYATDDTATTATGIAHISSLTAAAVKTITVTGDAGLALTNTNTTITTFNASGVTKGAVSWTTGALAAASTITGGAGDDTLNAAASTKAVTLDGGAGADTLTGSGTVASTITGGAGNDTITGGTGNDTITGGDGNDSITSGKGLDTVDVGAGTDTFVVTGNDNGNIYASITGMGTGDKIDFLAGGGVATFTTAKITLAGTAAFADFLQAATAGGADRVVWFQYGGDTYLVHDVSAGAAFVNGAAADQVVKLVGLVDLSTATIDGAVTNVLTL